MTQPPPFPPDGADPAVVPAHQGRRTHRTPASCSGCDRRWHGSATSHCAAHGCHRTFSSATAFDSHRTGGVCLDPAALADQHGRSRLRWEPARDGGVWVTNDSRPYPAVGEAA